MSIPRFTVCPSSNGPVCNVGNLPEGLADELQATVTVGKTAALGEQIKLTAAASGTAAAASSSSAAVVAVSAAPTPSAPPPPPPAGNTPPPVLPPLPNLGTNPTNPSGLFPTVAPAPSGSPGSAAAAHHRRGSGRSPAATTSATLPLSPRLIGGQLAGLAVLAGAVAMAIARLSLRAPRPEDRKDTSS